MRKGAGFGLCPFLYHREALYTVSDLQGGASYDFIIELGEKNEEYEKYKNLRI